MFSFSSDSLIVAFENFFALSKYQIYKQAQINAGLK